MSGFLSFDSFDAKKALKRKRGQAISSDSDDSEDIAKAKAKAKVKAAILAKKAAAAAAEEAAISPLEKTETMQDLAAEAMKGELPSSAVVRRYVGAAVREWKRWQAEGDAAMEKLSDVDKAVVAAAPPTMAVLKPLSDLMEMRAPGDTDASKVEKVCRNSLAQNHMGAEQEYIALTIGSVKWALGGGNFSSSDGPQAGNKCWGQKDRKVEATASLLDDGPQKHAIQGLKRLLTFVQALSVNGRMGK
ncbi:unnamed protein product [Polarella glacialis]|uniref:Prp18 domain-containing protein n=3 Tax=Polarella glacialis TaxID=89957 RepID=A0A813EX09_POLGL|nr:unnamed protein product [Polarella glacialis]